MTTQPIERQPSERVYVHLRAGVLRGEYAPRQALKPQELANEHGVSLAVVREALLRLVGEGLAERLPNRGFAVPATGDERWQRIAEARALIEPATLRLAIERGDLEWEARVRAAHHRLAGTPVDDLDTWSEAHRLFHRVLLEGCANDALLETFDRLWTASELARRWSARAAPGRDHATEHRAIEEAALARAADRAAELLRIHVSRTVEALAIERP
ncbi:GntR family transcriptional regulator [Dactylosporangium sp. NPDC049140]|uniref:GntR family transcriptional regulator n=1 Tax=Dactylosporangium sp. NPDC049140 TaxID=3155647 RepID=UPI0033EB27F2